MTYRTETQGLVLGSNAGYAMVGSSVLPRYVSIGADDAPIPDVTIINQTEPTKAEMANTAAIQAGLLFFIGLALGYLWGGTTGNVARR